MTTGMLVLGLIRKDRLSSISLGSVISVVRKSCKEVFMNDQFVEKCTLVIVTHHF